MSPSKFADNTQFYIEALFKLLGFDYAADGEKAPPFTQEFKSLGLQFDLKRANESCFTLGHTESRRRELLEQLDYFLQKEDALVNTKELERLHGRLVWFNSFVSGRDLKAAVKIISQFSRSSSNSTTFALSNVLREALLTLRDELAKSEPVVVRKAVSKTWDHLYRWSF